MTRMQVSTHSADSSALLSTNPTPEQLAQLEALMLSVESVKGVVDLRTQHHHADGNRLYGRSILLPADHVLLGGEHTAGCLIVCVGDITVTTDDGPVRLTGINVLPGKPGSQRVGHAHTDTFWLTVHVNPTAADNVAAIEDALCPQAERLMSRRTNLELQ
jgi:hypothetical protein